MCPILILTIMLNISYGCGICQNYRIAIAILLTNIFGLLRFILLLIECLILVRMARRAVLRFPIMSPKVPLASDSFSLFPFGDALTILLSSGRGPVECLLLAS